MSTLFVALASMLCFVIAYHTYGRWLSRRLFGLVAGEKMPSEEFRDNVDFVPTRRSIVLGHHFTSIAGTGPIVGPALAVFWGWLPALLWVVFGSILIGGVHDLSALVISLRNRGESVGQSAGRLISPRAKVLFLVVLAMALSVVLAIFGLVIANIFELYPESVLSVWIAMPVAITIGWWVYRRGGGLVAPSVIGLSILYGCVWLGAYHVPLDIGRILPAESTYFTPVVIWTSVLLAYAFVASVLPVWLLLQPRDYINSLQLFLALGLLAIGIAVASFNGTADLSASAPAVAQEIPADAPPILPFLFITIACGACSGFHCLVSSGTTSKQVASAADALPIGYGSMLLEGMLAVIVILACCAGVGLGAIEKAPSEAGGASEYRHTGQTGSAAWRSYYRTGANGEENAGWKKQNLAKKLKAFVDGGANFLNVLGMPLRLAVALMAVLVACFAATTLDTATRLQRYVLSELAMGIGVRPLANKYAATAIAVGIGLGIAIFVGDRPGTGGLVLWPLFGATNQLLAGLALLVALFYLARRSKPLAIIAAPMMMMMLMPAWAISHDLWNNWIPDRNGPLILFGLAVLGIQGWMIFEAGIAWRNCRGVLEPPPEALLPNESPARNG